MEEQKFIRDGLLLWTTIDPIGTLALFAGLSASLSAKQRFRTAVRATVYSALILVGAIIVGQLLLKAMGIAMISLQVAGGAVLFLFALQMIFGRHLPSASERPEAQHDLAVFPLAMPSIASPGAIMAVILLTDNSLHSIPVQLGTTAVMLGVLIATCLLMLAATFILRLIGHSGAAVLVRVMGLILAALSVQLVFEALGIRQWIEGGT